MTILQDILAAVGWQTRVTENFRSVSPAGLYGINPATTTGLTLGYYGGHFNGLPISNGTVALTASATNYVVAHRTTGAVTASTGTTNWFDVGTYLQLYDFVASTGSFTIAATSDKRQSIGGAGTGGAALTNFTESVNTAAPNATTPVVRLIATNAGTNVDVALTPKGSGAIAAQIADNTATGGNKRGTYAVDWQMQRGAAASVASGNGAGILAGNDNLASGAQAVVVGGSSNSASNNGGGILCGNNNVVSTANYAAIICGNANTASGTGALVLNGDTNLANSAYSAAMGARATTRAIVGAFAHSSSPSPSFVAGARQSIRLTLQADTTNATPAAMTTNGSAAAATNQFLLVSDSGLKARGQVIVRNAATGDCGWWDISGACKNVAGTVSLSGTPVISAYAGDASLNTCAVAIVADNTAKSLQVQATGIAATTLIWAAEVSSAEIIS